jgi:uncharacterized protein
MGKTEIRSLSKCELRAAPSGRRLEGYAAVFNSLSEPLGGFVERILPGAFSRSLREGADVRALVDHLPSNILGRTKSRTLRLSEDSKGLHFDIPELPNTNAGNDILESVKRGDVSQCSFGFVLKQERWVTGTPRIRELIDVDLFDVSVVTYPAYEATSVSVRSNYGAAASFGSYRGVHVALPSVNMLASAEDHDRLRVQLQIARRL